MNKLRGIIQKIDSHDGISIVTVKSNTIMFKSVILEDASISSYLVVGNEVSVLFKETEVIIVKSEENISLRNRIRCTIIEIDQGKLLSKLKLQHNEEEFYSIITSEAVDKLALTPGLKVIAMVKTNEIMIAE